MGRDIINLLVKISDHEQDNDAYIASMILNHIKEIHHMKNKDLAKLCNVDSATISRFIQRLGFDSYISFKDWAKQIFRSIDYDQINLLSKEDVVEKDIVALQQTKKLIDEDTIDELAEDLLHYDHIILSGGRYSQLVCQDLQMRLLSVGKYTKTFKDTKQQNEHLKRYPNGLLIQFSASYSHPDAMLTENIAKENGYKIYLITRLGNEIGGPDHTIYFNNNPKGFSVNSMEDRLCMLVIVDMIFLAYLKKLQNMQ